MGPAAILAEQSRREEVAQLASDLINVLDALGAVRWRPSKSSDAPVRLMQGSVGLLVQCSCGLRSEEMPRLVPEDVSLSPSSTSLNIILYVIGQTNAKRTLVYHLYILSIFISILFTCITPSAESSLQSLRQERSPC